MKRTLKGAAKRWLSVILVVMLVMPMIVPINVMANTNRFFIGEHFNESFYFDVIPIEISVEQGGDWRIGTTFTVSAGTTLFTEHSEGWPWGGSVGGSHRRFRLEQH